ncbi:hypothetical protein BpHYR1_050033 [Brachionus plicatilis]|uniref:Uncharacterized protein n=1 Tax=Brachionus plicatilis TaxID=10195 RepID=A0A3M7P5Y2_BRAPC|nr:hypothetical protein BpHYR1_050033 [Brachionus plicatilis]
MFINGQTNSCHLKSKQDFNGGDCLNLIIPLLNSFSAQVNIYLRIIEILGHIKMCSMRLIDLKRAIWSKLFRPSWLNK